MDSIVDGAIETVEEDEDFQTDSDPDPVGTNPDSEPEPTPEVSVGATPSNNMNGMSDDELEDVLDELQTEITVVGCGGAGGNTITRFAEAGIDGANLCALNTDVQHLVREVSAESKQLIGKQLTQGRGAGSNPRMGEEAAQENYKEIEAMVESSDMVFVTAGMGGGTGTGSAPVVAEAASDAGALTISIVTMPFTSEGEVRRANAEGGLARLRDVSDTVIVVPNDRMLEMEQVAQLPISKAFQVADEVLMRSVKGITELITNPGMVNLDFADVTTIMENGGVAMIGLGESDSEQKARDSVRSALSSPLLDVDISGATSVLVNVTGGNDMSIEEAEGVVDQIHDRVDPDARIIWGTSVDESLQGEIRTMLVVTGVDSPQMFADASSDADGSYHQRDSVTGTPADTETTTETGTTDSSTATETDADADAVGEDLEGIDYVR